MQYYNIECANIIKQTKQSAKPHKEKPIEPCPREDIKFYEDKWHQILKMYPRVHICEEAQSVLIKPKDTMLLSERYHDLSTNSFLLHSYYNYRQLLLFYYKNLGEYYIGAPGICCERQQRIAKIFGFEGFEPSSPKGTQGAFGYYVKKVEI